MSIYFNWFLAISFSTVLILFEITELLSRWVLTDFLRFSCVSVIVFSASLISLLSESVLTECAYFVMLNEFPSSLCSCNLKLLFFDFISSICTCNFFYSFLKSNFSCHNNNLSSNFIGIYCWFDLIQFICDSNLFGFNLAIERMLLIWLSQAGILRCS